MKLSLLIVLIILLKHMNAHYMDTVLSYQPKLTKIFQSFPDSQSLMSCLDSFRRPFSFCFLPLPHFVHVFICFCLHFRTWTVQRLGLLLWRAA